MFKLIWTVQESQQLTSQLHPNSARPFEVVLAHSASEVAPHQIGILYPQNDPEQAKLLAEAIKLVQPRLLFETREGWELVAIYDLAYLESFGNDILVHRCKNSSFIIREPLYQLEEVLVPYHFLRVGKSYVVSLAAIQRIRSQFNAKLLLELEGNHTVEVSRSYVRAFKTALGLTSKEDPL
jgi:DNA-binding LytR/AlgR family response regulator